MREAEMKSTEERLKKRHWEQDACFWHWEHLKCRAMQADAASQVQSRALLVTRGDYEGTEYDLTPDRRMTE